MYNFNVRVYGLLISDSNQILISDEEEQGFRFSKFPGGGVEYGEGLIDALKREFMEECNTEIEVLEHFYTTDFFIKSAFNDSQIISVYYVVRPLTALGLDFKNKRFDFALDSKLLQAFRWMNIGQMSAEDVTFATDQKVLQLLKEKWLKDH